MSSNPNYKVSFDFIKKYISGNLDATLFVLGYNVYMHAIDDIIDGDKTDSEHIIKTFELAAIVYSSPFYIQNMHILYPLVKMAGDMYANSVLFEKSNEKWKKGYADVLRHSGANVVLAAIEIVHGRDVRRQASQDLMSVCYQLHHDKDGKPV